MSLLSYKRLRAYVLLIGPFVEWSQVPMYNIITQIPKYFSLMEASVNQEENNINTVFSQKASMILKCLSFVFVHIGTITQEVSSCLWTMDSNWRLLLTICGQYIRNNWRTIPCNCSVSSLKIVNELEIKLSLLSPFLLFIVIHFHTFLRLQFHYYTKAKYIINF